MTTQPAGQPAGEPETSLPARPVHAVSALVLASGLVFTILLVVATRSAFHSNEDRLLQQRTREAAAVLTAALPGIQTPLASAAAVAEEDSGDQTAFERLMTPLVDQGRPYVSASLWQLGADSLEPLLVVGAEPKLAAEPPNVVAAFLARATAAPGLAVIDLLDGDEPRLGYAFTSMTEPIRYVAYAEAALPADRTAVVPADSAFSGLDNAVYFGNSEDPQHLLTASTFELPLAGPTASETVSFGDSTLLLVMSPTTNLSGDLLASLPWMIGVVGALTTLGATLLVERLLRRRDQAESLAAQNRHLYTNQLSVARTLQRSLLPQRIPVVSGLGFDVRYVPGVEGLDIGGDWYDVVELDGDRVLVVIGDVSGQGLQAGTTMASLRFAIRAFASRGDDPATILTSLTRLLDVEVDGHFATVLCAAINTGDHTISIANTGHPSPALVDARGVRFLDTDVGPPIGVVHDTSYASVTHSFPADATLLAFTDGLFERRGENIDVGLNRLRQAVPMHDDGLGDLLDRVLSAQLTHASHDDSAIIGVRWTSQ